MRPLRNLSFTVSQFGVHVTVHCIGRKLEYVYLMMQAWGTLFLKLFSFKSKLNVTSLKRKTQ